MRVISLLALASVTLPHAHADALLGELREKAFDAPVLAYDVEFDHAGQTFQAEVDATRPEGERMAVTSPAETEWPEDFDRVLERMDKSAGGAIWCDEFIEAMPEAVDRVDGEADTATYVFTPEPEPGADGAERKLFEKLVATMVVDPETLTVQSYQLHLPEPTKPHFLAKIETFSLFVDCQPHESGNSHFTRFDMDIAGSAMGNDFNQVERRRVSNLRPPEFPAEG
ncbi:MAG: hypothetical protein AAGI03_04815 [Pseudomonadota bacterium]